MAKPTMQELANQAGVSRITVWKVLNHRDGVSQAVRERVLQKAADVGYSLPGAPTIVPEKERVFAVAVSRPESSVFWMTIIHHLAKELAKHHVRLMYTYMPTAWQEGFTLPTSLSPESVDAFLVLNVYDRQLLRLLAEQKVPKVFLDTVPGLRPPLLGGDLVLLEGRTQTREITARLLRSGRRNLGFIGDVDYAQTNFERYSGFLDAHRALGRVPDPSMSRTEPLGLHSHFEEISAFLDGLATLPDAFICASDFIASFVNRYFVESGRAVPEGFVLTGFDNNPEYPGVAEKITTVNVETSVLGKSLARKLLFRADAPLAPYEITYVSTDILYRAQLAVE